MDKSTRAALRTAVGRCRRLLEEATAQTLEGQYGIHRDGRVEADDAMGHLTDSQREHRAQVADHLEHIRVGGFTPADSVTQLIRVIAYTHLNRLCAYKLMEKRGVVREAVSRGMNSNGFKFYLADHPDDERRWSGGEQDVAYRNFLLWIGETVSDEIGVLFSLLDPANRVFPPQSVLDEVLEEINSEKLAEIWIEEETIGWIYQYFTPKEQREKARQESAAPRNSYELAFLNQFFTPEYVVQFLTDNTLGRTWYEMRKGETALKESCRYLVYRKHPVFLQENQGEPAPWQMGEEDRYYVGAGGDIWTRPDPSQNSVEYLFEYSLTFSGYEYAQQHFERECGDLANERGEEYSQTGVWRGSFEELRCCLFFEQRRYRHFGWDPEGEALTAIQALYRAICQQCDIEVEYIRHRPKRDPRNLRILDPACGSGHFLLYAYDLLERIYREAYADPELGESLQRAYPSEADLRLALPSLILEQNLHGVDIDMRAVQIASLALWLRAQRSYNDMGLGRDGRPLIERSNIVCAEPMPGEKAMLDEFVETLEVPLLGQLVQIVFREMEMAGEAGSLVKIEGSLAGAIRKAKEQWQAGPRAEQLALMPDEVPAVQTQLPFDLTGVTDQQFWHEVEARVLDALQAYAQQAQDGAMLARSLFAGDAARGFAFIDLCRKRFDVVLMNPPFGEPSKPSKPYIERAYPRTKNDIYAAFVERGVDLLLARAMLGAITSRTGFFLSSFQKWREQIVLKAARPIVVADLGQGVLDTAMVETAAYCLEAAG